LNDKALALSSDGHFAFGFNRDAEFKPQVKLARMSRAKQQTKELVLSSRQYDGFNVLKASPVNMCHLHLKLASVIRQDNAQIGKARRRNDDRSDFMQAFSWPAQGPIAVCMVVNGSLMVHPKIPISV